MPTRFFICLFFYLDLQTVETSALSWYHHQCVLWSVRLSLLPVQQEHDEAEGPAVR